MQGMGRIEDWMVAEEGSTVSVVQNEAKSGPPFAKTAKGRPPQKKSKSKSKLSRRVKGRPPAPEKASQNHFGVLTGGHPPAEFGGTIALARDPGLMSGLPGRIALLWC